MLSNDTKKVIDDARDTLVGQIPVPMMQCQQITLALTYKFMSDDDLQAVKLGGLPHYFTGDLEGYEWGRIMNLRLDDTQRSELYRAGLNAIGEAESLPTVFREIFKDAVVPYGDHRTLALFLSTVNRVEYDDSEKLGDAYEYLLKIAEAQADAGQFRTPRHIINFIVSIINPQKHEVIIDPACGTAGFLVSAYQHVLSQHRLPGGGTSLSTPDRARLADNLRGYDISPEMTKLSMANMYLHTQNKDPNVHNYDTLTSTDHWNEYADVMLANPPFMTPKGGIKPHGLFRVPAKRAEVLFVDYIATHLNEHGRAGIIVPEGIIFQSQHAYKQLRRLLVEESLVAVISLPSGVFQPYSGVKTSILILDKVLAPKADNIAFFKVENDGYDLGAQRRPIDKDDLPAVTDEVDWFLRRLRKGETVGDYNFQKGHIASKIKIATDGEYNLSGERYSVAEITPSRWPVVKLSEVCDINPDTIVPATEYPNSTVFYADISSVSNGDGRFLGYNKVGSSEAPSRARRGIREGDILLSTVRPNLKAFTILKEAPERAIASTGFAVLRVRPDIAEPRLILALIRSDESVRQMIAMMGKGSYPSINQSDVASIEVPLPPLEVQREIVAEIEGYQRVLDGARAVVENYRPHFNVDPDWPLVAIQDFAKPQYGFTASAQDQGDARFIRITDISEGGFLNSEEQKFIDLTSQSKEALLSRGDILVARTGATYGKTMLFDEDYPAVFASYLIRLRFPSDVVDPHYYWAFAQSDNYWNQAKVLMTGGGQPQFNGNAIKQVKLPLPPLATQHAIVADIEAEQALVQANRELIRRFERKIETAIAQVWHMEATALAVG